MAYHQPQPYKPAVPGQPPRHVLTGQVVATAVTRHASGSPPHSMQPPPQRPRVGHWVPASPMPHRHAALPVHVQAHPLPATSRRLAYQLTPQARQQPATTFSATPQARQQPATTFSATPQARQQPATTFSGTPQARQQPSTTFSGTPEVRRAAMFASTSPVQAEVSHGLQGAADNFQEYRAILADDTDDSGDGDGAHRSSGDGLDETRAILAADTDDSGDGDGAHRSSGDGLDETRAILAADTDDSGDGDGAHRSSGDGLDETRTTCPHCQQPLPLDMDMEVSELAEQQSLLETGAAVQALNESFQSFRLVGLQAEQDEGLLPVRLPALKFHSSEELTRVAEATYKQGVCTATQAMMSMLDISPDAELSMMLSQLTLRSPRGIRATGSTLVVLDYRADAEVIAEKMRSIAGVDVVAGVVSLDDIIKAAQANAGTQQSSPPQVTNATSVLETHDDGGAQDEPSATVVRMGAEHSSEEFKLIGEAAPRAEDFIRSEVTADIEDPITQMDAPVVEETKAADEATAAAEAEAQAEAEGATEAEAEAQACSSDGLAAADEGSSGGRSTGRDQERRNHSRSPLAAARRPMPMAKGTPRPRSKEA
eukprot:TRINITY_DN181_c0_g4_i4.p1 TRINITY_DN181_c0_g4~~TRINITY_DN181_c0_g4_i4.p1  ORF type:complete len:598 (+),score=132.76 TRINITY_DN181_c0_g4_i4:254-2047(+)